MDDSLQGGVVPRHVDHVEPLSGRLRRLLSRGAEHAALLARGVGRLDDPCNGARELRGHVRAHDGVPDAETCRRGETNGSKSLSADLLESVYISVHAYICLQDKKVQEVENKTIASI